MPEPKSPVIVGLEPYEIVFGKDQPEYMPLPALRSPEGRVMSRWELTPQERAAIYHGADLLITVHTFNQPYPPMSVEVAFKQSPPDLYAGKMCIDAYFSAKEGVDNGRRDPVETVPAASEIVCPPVKRQETRLTVFFLEATLARESYHALEDPEISRLADDGCPHAHRDEG